MVLPQNVRSAITMWASPKPYNTLFARTRTISDANKTQIETRVESRNLCFEKKVGWQTTQEVSERS